MFRILRSEWYKLRKSRLSWVLLAGPLVALMSGTATGLYGPDEFGGDPSMLWLMPLFSMNLSYGLLFLPLITGVLAGLICRYEHQEGGWKQLLALPVTRGRVFVAKYTLLMAIVFAMQLLYLAAIYLVGVIHGIGAPLPPGIAWKIVLGGWVAAFPLVALQLWMSVMWKSFAAPFSVNVVFTLPAIMAINSERFGPYYPWAQPFSMMYHGMEASDVFHVPWEQLILVIGGSFIVFFVAGFVYFHRKSV